MDPDLILHGGLGGGMVVVVALAVARVAPSAARALEEWNTERRLRAQRDLARDARDADQVTQLRARVVHLESELARCHGRENALASELLEKKTHDGASHSPRALPPRKDPTS